MPALAPAKVLRSDAAVPTKRRSSRASRATASTTTAASEDSRGAAAVAGPQQAATSRSLRFLIEASVNIVIRAVSVWECLLPLSPAARGQPPPFIGQGEAVYRRAAL
jgi:hypothetical protein